MHIDDFDFDLPEELIALDPVESRDQSRLLHVGENDIQHYHFADLPYLLRPNDLLVLNDTKVIPAAVQAVRPARSHGGGGDVTLDINFLSQIQGDKDLTVWQAFARPAKRLADNDILHFTPTVTGVVERRTAGEVYIRFPAPPEKVMAMMAEVGKMPLPPYIARKRPLKEQDKTRYQTVYAALEGSVAAPTAGLHFSQDTFTALAERSIDVARVTLHVGAGTFLPVSAKIIEDHKMHAEWGSISPDAAEKIIIAKNNGRRIISVGTTTTRLLESAAPASGVLSAWQGETDIFIKPGYEFKIIDAMITNFHLPKSTLLMLISAFAGTQRVRDAYRVAIEQRYRFFSYGDACLFERAIL